MGLLETVTPYLEMFRTFLNTISSWIATAFKVEVSNVYIISLVIISVYLGKIILEFFYTTLEGRQMYWLILTIAIFWVLRFLGV